MGSRLHIGLVYDLLGSAPAGPPDADAEYEPIETVEALEGAIRRLGHEPVRLGSPRELLAAFGRGALPKLDAAWNIACNIVVVVRGSSGVAGAGVCVCARSDKALAGARNSHKSFFMPRQPLR
jgi:hypothetical protein